MNFPGQGRSSLFVSAQEDEAEGEEGDEGAVEDEEGGSDVENEEDAAADEEETNKNVHKDADTQLLFTKPSIISTFESGSVELPAGKVSKLSIYWSNFLIVYDLCYGLRILLFNIILFIGQ